MAIETISVKDAADATKGILADKIGAGEEYAQVLKLAYGADGFLVLMDEKPATEASLAAVNAKTPALTEGRVPVALPEAQTTDGGAVLTGTARDKFYTQFFNFDTTNDWELLHATALSGTGAFSAGANPNMAVTGPLGGAAAGTTPYVNIASGTTPNVATLVLARPIMRAPLEARVGITMSQRLAECQVLAGFFECDPATGALVRDSTYSAVDTFLNLRNMAAFRLDGTTATQSNAIYRASGAGAFTAGATSFAGFTTVASGTGPNFIYSDELVLNFERDALNFRTVDLNSPTFQPTNLRRSDAVPNPTRSYRFGVIVLNSGTPASSTDVRLHFVNILDSARLDVSVRNTTSDVNRALAVWTLGGSNTTLNASANLVGDAGLQVRANATGAGTPANVNSPATPAAQSLKASAGRICSYDFTNINTTLFRYVKFFNTAGAVTMGTTAAAFEIAIPPSQGRTLALPFAIAMSAGIQIAVTGGRGLTDNTAVTLGDVVGHIETA